MKSSSTERRVGIYVRISKDRKREVSTSIQRETCAKYAADKGWAVGDTYEDRGLSAYRRGVVRPSLVRLMADVEAGLVNVVVCYKLDRVSRSARDFANLWERLEASNCEFVSVSEQFDTSGAMGKAMLTIASAFAELASAMTSERITDVHDRKRAKGEAPSGPRPFGYNADRTIIEAEAALIRDAAARVIAGGSLRGLVVKWNAEGIRTVTGRQWSHRGLRHVLTNPHTAGLREVEGALVSGIWPAVLDRSTHDALVAVVSDPTRRHSLGNTPVHLLTGIVRCGLCATPMTCKAHVKGARYLCGPRKGFTGCGRQSIKADATDEIVTADVLDALDIDALAAAIEGRRADPGIVADQLETELEQLARDFGAGDLSRAEWQAARTGVELRLDDARRSATRSKSAAPLRKLRTGNPATKFAALDLADQRLVLLAVLDSVDIAPADPRGELADRITYTWRDATT
jgi:site-specific DNA recombinase